MMLLTYSHNPILVVSICIIFLIRVATISYSFIFIWPVSHLNLSLLALVILSAEFLCLQLSFLAQDFITSMPQLPFQAFKL
jgi:hypothetical protein